MLGQRPAIAAQATSDELNIHGGTDIQSMHCPKKKKKKKKKTINYTGSRVEVVELQEANTGIIQ